MQLLQCSTTLLLGSVGNALPRCLGAVGKETRALQCLSNWEELFSCTATLLTAVGSGTRAMHCLSDQVQ